LFLYWIRYLFCCFFGFGFAFGIDFDWYLTLFRFTDRICRK
jgi:hypothetical protein